MKLWNYALTTQIPLPADTTRGNRKKIGWSSGHRIDHLYAESWATASVFSYAQALRRLLGVWTREAAGKSLRQILTQSRDTVALDDIRMRGDTWPVDSSSEKVGDQLLGQFVNPALKTSYEPALEPDFKPIGENQSRSAILFGPPGTSKTYLAHAVARAIGWHYVELHASHFVAEGLPVVQRTADEIFQRLMQLDHCVILFDEIDELVRERDVEPDAFGRFLTTSMLPKLAELWKQRKVIYFIATNHIEYFDRAVTRAQRFDALIFVTPPSFGKKMDELDRLLRQKLSAVTLVRSVNEVLITEALMKIECSGRSSPDALLDENQTLAKFIMLRWDQLEELSMKVIELAGGSPALVDLTPELLGSALTMIADPSLQTLRTYCPYLNSARYSMRDFGKEIIPSI
jgi:SpoVK/Ycf46/Vps4 family AAA+-type ATPase